MEHVAFALTPSTLNQKHDGSHSKIVSDVTVCLLLVVVVIIILFTPPVTSSPWDTLQPNPCLKQIAVT